MTDIYDNDKIQRIIKAYQKQRDRDKLKYQNKKDDPDFIKQNRDRAKAHYQANKQIKADNYKNNKDFLRCRSLHNYYKLNNRVDEFIDKYPDKVTLLKDHGFTCASSSSGGTMGSSS